MPPKILELRTWSVFFHWIPSNDNNLLEKILRSLRHIRRTSAVCWFNFVNVLHRFVNGNVTSFLIMSLLKLEMCCFHTNDDTISRKKNGATCKNIYDICSIALMHPCCRPLHVSTATSKVCFYAWNSNVMLVNICFPSNSSICFLTLTTNFNRKMVIMSIIQCQTCVSYNKKYFRRKKNTISSAWYL